MTLTHILVFSAAALLVGWKAPPHWRGWVLLAGSLAAIYWMQPSTPVRNLDFWFPTASIALTVFVWAVTQPARPSPVNDQGEPQPTRPAWRAELPAGLLILGAILAIGLTRYLGPVCCLTPTRPPGFLAVAAAVALGSVAATIPARMARRPRLMPVLSILLILALFIVLKSQPLAQEASVWLRRANSQSVELATFLDLQWLGFSYLAFRLLHALRDHQMGKLPPYSLGEFVTYAIFFPTYTAGPIDRSQHFVDELRRVMAPDTGVDTKRLVSGAQRILIGVFKKFVLADSLALIALNPQNAGQLESTLWAWVLLYAYALRIYFDFSGYTDIALGIGRLLGFNLPENFDRPYLTTNLTAFWNSWHITLAQWFRAYFFNPMTRALRSRPQKLPVWQILLVGQLGTMLLIGLWHGIAWNFALWGAWHGLGLFVHNRWSDWARKRLTGVESRPRLQRLLQAGGWALTFHYVALGWVWFALPTPELAANTFGRLFGW